MNKIKNEVTKIEHVWCDSNDRWIYIEYNEQREIVGLNFMQGDEYEYFKESWACNNPYLMAFYTTMLHTFPIEKLNVTTLNFINKVMWAFHETGLIFDKFNN